MTRGQQLERALHVLAYVVVRHGEQYGCLLERVQAAIEEDAAQPDYRAMAARILAGNTREVRSAPGA